MKVKVIKRRPHGVYAKYDVGEVIDVPGDELGVAARFIANGFWEEYTAPAPEPEPESEPVVVPRTKWKREIKEPTEGEDE